MSSHKTNFLQKFGVSEDQLTKCGLKWELLDQIHADHTKKGSELAKVGTFVTETLRKCEQVHSLKFRIKDPDHLVGKIIRKAGEAPEMAPTVSNYSSKITDLIGVRVLHLFKEDWEKIHDFISSEWHLAEKPRANYRKGDEAAVLKRFKAKGCVPNEHPFGYRSIHYVIEMRPSKNAVVRVEIQVRTIFEEGWSEIDHLIRYPNQTTNPILNQFLALFNRMAGGADEMGSFIRFLTADIEKRETEFAEKLKEKDQTIADLTAQIDQSGIEKKKREELQETVRRLKEQSLVTVSPALGSLMESMGGGHAKLGTLFESHRATFEEADKRMRKLQRISQSGGSKNSLSQKLAPCGAMPWRMGSVPKFRAISAPRINRSHNQARRYSPGFAPR